jgi:hypothetical protein
MERCVRGCHILSARQAAESPPELSFSPRPAQYISAEKFQGQLLWRTLAELMPLKRLDEEPQRRCGGNSSVATTLRSPLVSTWATLLISGFLMRRGPKT